MPQQLFKSGRKSSMFKAALFTGWFLFVGLSDLQAQQQSFGFEQVKKVGETSISAVEVLSQDKSGFLWIGTQNGLKRFDGQAVESLFLGAHIVDLIQDVKRNLVWVRTNLGTVYGVKVNDLSIPYTYRPETIRSGMLLAETGDLWIGKTNGVIIWNPEEGLVKPVDFLGQLEAGGTVVEKIIQQNDQVIALTNRDIVMLNSNGSVVSETPFVEPLNRIKEIQVDLLDLSLLWIAAENGLYQLNLETQQLVLITNVSNVRTNGYGNALYQPKNDPNIMWLATHLQGIFRIDKSNGNVISSFNHDPAENNSLGDNTVYDFLEDRVGNLWVGMFSGLSLLPFRASEFNKVQYKNNTGLPSKPVFGLGQTNHGVWVKNTTSELSWCLGNNCKSIDLAGEIVDGMITDRSGGLWIINENQLAYIASPETPYNIFFWNDNRLKGKFFSEIIISHYYEGEYVLLGSRGIWRADPQGNKLAELSANATWKRHAIVSSIEDENGIWFGTYLGGLGFYDYLTDSTQYWMADENLTNGLISNKVVSVAKDHSNQLWLATDGGGLCSFDQQSDTFTCFTQDNSDIPADGIASIEVDKNGYLWLGTHNGISQFDPVSKSFTSYDVGDGLPSDFYFYNASGQNEAGVMVFGSDDGFVYIDPNKVHPSTFQANMVLTKIKVKDRSFRNIPQENIELAYNENNISFNFALLDLTDPERNYYQIALDKNDPDSSKWDEIGHQASWTYTSIEPGDYVFRVTGANHDRVASKDTLSVAFTVREHFAQTAWFWALMSGLFFSVVFYSMYLIFQERAKEAAERQKMRVKIAGDLHDELGGRIGGISITAKMVADSLDSDNFHAKLLYKASDSAVNVVDDMRDIIWMINPVYDSIEELIEKMDAYAETLLQGKEYAFVPPAAEVGDRLKMTDRRHLYLFFKEAIHNIHRHAEAQNVSVSFVADNEELTFEIKDDGVGFDMKNPGGSGTGLNSFQNRANEMKAELVIESSPGQGTSLKLIISLVEKTTFTQRVWARRMPAFLGGNKDHVVIEEADDSPDSNDDIAFDTDFVFADDFISNEEDAIEGDKKP